MPPSYSMMLPGRIDTPLIFMGDRLMLQRLKEPLRRRCRAPSERDAPLARRGLSGKQRIGVDRGALPPFVARVHAVDRHVKVRPRRIGIARKADKAERGSAPHALPLAQARRISAEVGVIIAPALVVRADIDAEPAAA